MNYLNLGLFRGFIFDALENIPLRYVALDVSQLPRGWLNAYAL